MNWACASSWTWSRTTAPTSTNGSSRPCAKGPAHRCASASTSARAAGRTAPSPRTTGSPSSAGRRGRGSPTGSGTCTSSPPNSPTSTGNTPPSRTSSAPCCGSGSTWGWTVSVLTSPTGWSRRPGCPTWGGASSSGCSATRCSPSSTRTASTRSTGRGGRCWTSTPATASASPRPGRRAPTAPRSTCAPTSCTRRSTSTT